MSGAIPFWLAAMLAASPAWAHRSTTDADLSGITVPGLTHGQMAVIADHRGVIPPELEEAFAYLSEQNVILARRAARGVMAGFAATPAGNDLALPEPYAGEPILALPAA